MSKHLMDGKTLEIATILDDFNYYVETLLEDEHDIMNEELIAQIQSEVDDLKKSIIQTRESSEDISEESISITRMTEASKDRINDIVMQKKKPMDLQAMSLLMLNISRKLDKVMQQQADEKAKLTKIELLMKDIEADGISKQYEAPLVPKKDVEFVFHAICKEFRGMLSTLETEGIEAFDAAYGKRFEKFSKPEVRTKKAITLIAKVSMKLINFVEDPNEWRDVYHTNIALREDMNFLELKKADYIATALNDSFNFGSTAFGSKIRSIVGIVADKAEIPILLQEALKKGLHPPKTEKSRERDKIYHTLCAKYDKQL